MASPTSKPILEKIVRPMERGQITIPVSIRKKLKITPKTWLWVRLVGDKILIKSVEKEPPAASLADYLLSTSSDSKTCWTKEDINSLKKAAKKTKERLEELVK